MIPATTYRCQRRIKPIRIVTIMGKNASDGGLVAIQRLYLATVPAQAIQLNKKSEVGAHQPTPA